MIKDFFHKSKTIKDLKRGDVLNCKRVINHVEKIYFYVIDDINFNDRFIIVHRIKNLFDKKLNAKISIMDLHLRGFKIVDCGDYWGF
jgi:hypothetical protein